MLNTVLCTSHPNDKVAFELWAKALPKMNASCYAVYAVKGC